MAVFGGAAVLLGVFPLFNPFAAVRTLALLLGLALVIGGVMEIALGWASARRSPSFVPGAILVIGGLLLLYGMGPIATAFMARSEVSGWLASAGVFNVVAGIAALAWPEATLFVLSLIVGFQVLTFGVCLLVVAFTKSRSAEPAAA